MPFLELGGHAELITPISCRVMLLRYILFFSIIRRNSVIELHISFWFLQVWLPILIKACLLNILRNYCFTEQNTKKLCPTSVKADQYGVLQTCLFLGRESYLQSLGNSIWILTAGLHNCIKCMYINPGWLFQIVSIKFLYLLLLMCFKSCYWRSYIRNHYWEAIICLVYWIELLQDNFQGCQNKTAALLKLQGFTWNLFERSAKFSNALTLQNY